MIVLKHKDANALGADASRLAALKINKAIEENGCARIAVSTGVSQLETLEVLIKENIDWSKVEMFQIGEYVNLPASHPASFKMYLEERFVSHVNLKKVYFADGNNAEESIKYLTEEITKNSIDVALIGIDENASLALNNPPADFDTKESYIVVNLNEKYRMQQVRDGYFSALDDVPKQAISMTPHQIMRSKTVISAVPHKENENAIKLVMENDVTNNIPATLLKIHPDMYLIVDDNSAGGAVTAPWSYTMGRDDFKFIQLSSLEKVFLDIVPQSTELEQISCMKNERINYQIAYSHIGMPVGDACVYEFDVEIDSLLKNYIKLRRVGNVPVELSYYRHMCDSGCIRKGPGLYPDPLMEMKSDAIEVVPQLWHSMWITIDTKGEVPAGDYDVKIIFKRGEIKHIKTLKVKIINALLPKQDTIMANWFHTDCLASVYNVKMYSEKHWKIIDNFMKCAVNSGVNAIYTPIFSIALDTSPGKKRPACQLVDVTIENGEYSFGYDKLRRWISLFKKNGGDYLEISHLFSQWGAKYAPRITAKVNGRTKEIFGWKTSGTSMEYQNFLKLCLPGFVEVLKEEGVADRTFFHISDEPHLNTLESYMKSKKTVEKAIKGFRIIEACSDLEAYKTGAVEYPIVALSEIDGYLNNGVIPFGAYFCCSTAVGGYANRFIDMPSYRNRILGVQLFKYNIDCLAHFAFNYYFKREKLGGSAEVVNPFFATDAGNAIPAGNGFVVYPGDNGEAIESIRSINTYDAFQDKRAMRLLESYIGHEKTVELIERVAGNEIKFNAYPKNPEFILNMREAINHKIEEVIK